MKDEEKDGFWDIEHLLPKKRRRTASFDVSAKEILIEPAQMKDSPDRKINFFDRRESETKLLFRYCPDNSFVKNVGIYKRTQDTKYYEDFENTMHKYLRLTVKDAERVPYFSYFPQYSQMTRAQMEWYLFWRSGCRRREYMQTDFSYILLYVFELINFDNPRYPMRVAEELCCLWSGYRAEYPQLDKYLSSWLCDYCFIHKIPLPMSLISDFVCETVRYSYLKEAYLGAGCDAGAMYGSAVIYGVSGYNYKKSKYYTGGNKELFNTHICEAAAAGFCACIDSREEASDAPSSVMHREAFVGALCTSSAQRSIEIEYRPIYKTGALRAEATLAVKYAENRLRGILGIRSRLSVAGLSDRVKSGIDAYFFEKFGSRSERQAADRQRAEPEYMAYYESESTHLRTGHAAEIERASWETAILMGECFDCSDDDAEAAKKSTDACIEEDLPKAPSVPGIPLYGGADGDMAELVGALSEAQREILFLIASEKNGAAQRYAVSNGMFLSDAVGSINEQAIDIIGDILVECEGDSYRVPEEYESEVKKCRKI